MGNVATIRLDVNGHSEEDGAGRRPASVRGAKYLGTRTSVQKARAQASMALRSALKAHGITHEAFASRVGVSKSQVRNWCDPGNDSTIGDAYKIVAREVGLGGVIDSYRAALDVVNPAASLPKVGRLRLLQVEVGDVARTEMEAEADGIVTREEHLALAREWEDVARVSRDAHVYHLRQAIREEMEGSQ